jgi:hypothetical protein
MIEAISSKDTANMSCRTNAMRSAGVRRSSTTSSARPTESASRTSCLGVAGALAFRRRLGFLRFQSLLPSRGARA